MDSILLGTNGKCKNKSESERGKESNDPMIEVFWNLLVGSLGSPKTSYETKYLHSNRLSLSTMIYILTEPSKFSTYLPDEKEEGRKGSKELSALNSDHPRRINWQ